jgi:hypothetical protein
MSHKVGGEYGVVRCVNSRTDEIGKTSLKIDTFK